ncbi:hypothetical protein [Paenisporosarcina antarctica]|uniref:Uncharacterized protein n=1 Tax=Paenisporosarcina antarctica TaxID=417367 RepID=A0A4P7A3B0_9BACL|nr:hypothetical protein [Paenisporosarcina antarctica]QBP43174.1 hypothetical protein E2636_18630 [Paenisporosarcina antarctica]
MNILQMQQEVLKILGTNYAGIPECKSILRSYQMSRIMDEVNISDAKELQVFKFMKEEFHPTLFEMFDQAKPKRLSNPMVVGNICHHVAVYGIDILEKIYPDWDFYVLSFQQNPWGEHSVIWAYTGSDYRVIDLDRKELGALWWSTNKPFTQYPNGLYSSTVQVLVPVTKVTKKAFINQRFKGINGTDGFMVPTQVINQLRSKLSLSIRAL